MRRPRHLSALCLLVVAGVCQAATDSAFTLTVENDKFTGSDNNYTNGVGLSWSSGDIASYEEGSLPRRWAELWDFLPRVANEDFRTYASWTLGQEMYSPDDITLANPPLDDQPYAGVLFVDNTFHVRRNRWGHTWNVRLGVVGPASQADNIQTWVHDLIDTDEPRGWDTQLPNELLLNLDYSAGYVWRTGEVGKSFTWRLIPNGSVSLGNYFTGVSAGLHAEIGWNLSDALGMSTLRHGISTATTIGAGPQDHWSISFFAGGTAFGIAHYLPLDGTLFRDSRSVDSKKLVGLITAGMSIRRGPFVLSLAQTYFSKSFETEREGAEFGSLSLSWYF
ncbi:lipid A deacylase LpxR family protein [Elongatibacter sediminis]|uniref:Lipid A deacylase LpxR family protein n=1 Tax=Elongatibacter sediminis TaxID=3119006 RepID=A0AAW9RGC6_9GAMM